MYDNNYLMHYGVKGMKWGVRHDRPLSGRSARKERISNIRNSKPKYESFSDRPIIGRSERKRRVQENLKTIGGTPEERRIRKQKRSEKTKVAMSRVRNYTGSHTSDALKRSRKKDINKMSNRDLQNDINRLRLEREYRSLTKVDTSFGKNYMQDFNKHYSTATLTSKNASKAVGYGKQAVKAMKRTAKATAMA